MALRYGCGGAYHFLLWFKYFASHISFGGSTQTFVGCMRVALESFIKKRFLSDAETLTKYTKGRCTVPSGAFETRYKAQMRTLVLSRLMTLVFFLDLAKMENVIDKVPRLFGVSSEVKSSRDVLAMICRDCLSAEGDIVKHFSRIGLSVRYHQDPVDEVNLKVVNLATDLRDGVLLTRLSEIIMGVSFKSFMKTLRLPAVSRLQKKFNVNLALEKLRSFGVVIGSEINAHHIMDGHREMVLTLMWCIIAHCCLSKLLQEGHIEQEIKDVIRSSRERSKFQLGVLKGSHGDAGTSTKAIQKTESSSTERALKSLLKQWSQAVCSSFDLHVENFTDSFADGKVICALIHYYHPSLISLEHVVSFGEDDCVSQDARLEQERKNWKMALHSIRELGGVPAVFPICDSMSPPDEQSVLLCLSYLCSRLMESSKEIFATILIQACYRKYQRKLLLERKMKAAKVILQSWRENRGNYFRAQRQQYTLAVRVLEGFFLDHRYALLMLREARLERERRHQAAVTVQVSG
jgi:abnormal spindle-like microcephaly-associated protein